METNHAYLLLLLFQATLLVTSAMILTFLWSLKNDRIGMVDAVWCALFSPLVLSYAALGDGYGLRKLAISVMVCAWSLRLAIHLYRRLQSGPNPQDDPRYLELRRRWGQRAETKFLLLFLLQACLNLLLSIPFALICLNHAREISPLEGAGALIWVVGLIGEAIADLQLSRFKMATRGQVLNTGLWKYSRHPNYFFEWVIWCGYFVFALASPWGWATIYCPVVVYYLLNHVTGIPMAEEQAIKTRGQPYRLYQENTNAFFPGFPRFSSPSRSRK